MKITFTVDQIKDDRFLLRATAESGEFIDRWVVPNHVKDDIKRLAVTKKAYVEAVLDKLAESVAFMDVAMGNNPATRLHNLEINLPWPVN